MNFTTATIFFPVGRLSEEFIETYLNRYTFPVTDRTLLIAGETYTQSPIEHDLALSTAHIDSRVMNRFRKASVYNTSIAPSEVWAGRTFDEAGNIVVEGTLIGHTISCGWPQLFLDHVANPPPGDEALFSGVAIVEGSL